MSEAQFKSQFIAQFLASYLAQHFDSDSSARHPGRRYAHQPIEDATFLADQAWAQLTAQAEALPELRSYFELPRLALAA